MSRILQAGVSIVLLVLQIACNTRGNKSNIWESTAVIEDTVMDNNNIMNYTGNYVCICDIDTITDLMQLSVMKKGNGMNIILQYPDKHFTLDGEITRDTVNFDPEFNIWSIKDKDSATYGFLFEKEENEYVVHLINEDYKTMFETGRCAMGKIITFKKSIHSTLQTFWQAFQQALREKSSRKLIALTLFPIPGLTPFLEASTPMASLGADTAQFITALPDILGNVPREQVLKTSWDSLLVLDPKDFSQQVSGSEILLQTIDADSKVYICYAQWADNNGKETNQAFIFAKVKGTHKLCAIAWRGSIIY